MNINKYFINNLNEIIILKLPNNIIDKDKLYFDLIIFYEINIKIILFLKKNILKILFFLQYKTKTLIVRQ